MNNFNQQNYQNGTMYPNSVSQAKYTNPLSEEKIKQYSQTGGGFTLKVTQEEIDRAICTHRDPKQKQYTLIDQGDGSVVCKICGARFNPDQVDDIRVQDAVDVILNILQTSKMMYLNMPEQAAAQYYQMLPFLTKLPSLYKIAVDDFNRHMGGGNQQVGAMSNNTVAMFNNMMSGSMPYMSAPQGQTYGNPYAQQQPMMNNMGVQQQMPMQPAMNPFMVQQSQMVPQSEPVPVWACKCGSNNTGDFCSKCGQKKIDETNGTVQVNKEFTI